MIRNLIVSVQDISVINWTFYVHYNSSVNDVYDNSYVLLCFHKSLFISSRTVDDHTMFSVHTSIQYKKSVWGVVKGFIEKNTWNGLEDFYTALVRALQTEYGIPPAKAKSRRARRGALILRFIRSRPYCSCPIVNAPTFTVVEPYLDCINIVLGMI